MKWNEPDSLKEIHKIRLNNYEYTKDMTPEERSRLRVDSVAPILAAYGFRVVPSVKDKYLLSDAKRRNA